MEFRFDDDQLAIRDAVRAFCADRLSLDSVAGREGERAADEVWSGLSELGVLGMLASGTDTDSGTDVVEAAIVFEELGAHIVTGPVLWSVLAAPFVDGVAAGQVRAAGVEASERTHGPIVVEHGDECDVLLVLRAAEIEALSRSELTLTPSGPGLDPLTPTAVVEALPAGRPVGGAADAEHMRRLGAIFSAAMLVGGAQRSLDVAREYALERHQFGVPIGSFQAVKHLLADMYVRLELARSATYAAAAIAADPRAGDLDRAASTAKLLAGDAGIDNARAAVQILGGMGFTWDMLPHYLLKRSWVLEHSFGTRPYQAARLGDAVGAEVGA